MSESRILQLVECSLMSLIAFSNLRILLKLTKQVTTDAGRRNVYIIIVATVVPVVVSLALFIVGYCLLRKKASNKCGEIVEDGTLSIVHYCSNCLFVCHPKPRLNDLVAQYSFLFYYYSFS